MRLVCATDKWQLIDSGIAQTLNNLMEKCIGIDYILKKMLKDG